MTSAIGGMGGMMGGMNGMQRPDPAKMADRLFSKLDTKGQGYIEKSDLQNMFDRIASNTAAGSAASADDTFNALDNDGDGKITRQEMTDSLMKLADQLESQFQSMRMNGMGGGHGERIRAREGMAAQDSTEAAAADVRSNEARMMERIMDMLKSYTALDQDDQVSGSIVSTAV